MAFNARNYDVGAYQFIPYERRIFNQFDSEDRCTAYLTFANELQNANYRGHVRMHLWLGDGNYQGANPAHALDENDRVARIDDARVARENALDVDVSDRSSTPDSPVVPPDPAWDEIEAIEWVYAHTIHKKETFQIGDDVRRFSTVSVYIGQDRRRCMRDRIAIKTIEQGDIMQASANPPDETPQEIEEYLNELAATYELLEFIPSEHILRTRTMDVNRRSIPWVAAGGNVLRNNQGEALRVWYYGIRSYTDFCDGGNLEQLAQRYANIPEHQRYRKVPEMFLVVVLKAMAEALFILQTGEPFWSWNEEDDPRIQRPNEHYDQEMVDRNEAWEGPIVHNDISPANIFLKSSEHGHYPTVVLGDLEGCVRAGEEPFNPRIKFGFMPPEVARYYVGLIPANLHPISVKSDMWGLGSVMWTLMNATLGMNHISRIRNLYQIDMTEPGPDRILLYPRHASSLSTALGLYFLDGIQNVQTWYSLRLHEIVDRCLYTSPIRRWNPRQLREEMAEVLVDLDAMIDGIVEDGPRYDFGRLLAKHDPFRMDGIHNIRRHRPGLGPNDLEQQ